MKQRYQKLCSATLRVFLCDHVQIAWHCTPDVGSFYISCMISYTHTSWCLRWNSLFGCMYVLWCSKRKLVSVYKNCERHLLWFLLCRRFWWLCGLVDLRWMVFWSITILCLNFVGLVSDSRSDWFHLWLFLNTRWGIGYILANVHLFCIRLHSSFIWDE